MQQLLEIILAATLQVFFVGRGLTACGKSQFKVAFSSTGTLAYAGFAPIIIDAQPRVAVLLDFFPQPVKPRHSGPKNQGFRVCVTTCARNAFVASAFRPTLWMQAHARLKAGAT